MTETKKTSGSSFLARAAAALAAIATAGVIGVGGAALLPETAQAAGVSTTHQSVYATLPASVSVAQPKSGSAD